MSDNTKTVLLSLLGVLAFIGFFGLLGALSYANQDSGRPKPQQVNGGTVIRDGECAWFVTADGDNVILMGGREAFCHGSPRGIVITR